MASDPGPNPHFFVLRHALGSRHDTSFEREGNSLGEAPRCPRCGAFIGMREWLPPLRGVLQLHGEDFGDFVKGPGSGFLISKRFADAFRSEGLTGLSGFLPVEVSRVRGRRRGSPHYLFVTPIFGGAAVDEPRSRIRRSHPIACDACRETGVDAIHGFSLEAGGWTGDDVFFARGLPGSPVVSERFAHFVERHSLTNMHLIPTESYTWNPLALDPARAPEMC
jgi:hypothetical protein